MRNRLTVAGVNLTSTYGLQVSGYGTYHGGTRQFATFNVPSRNGLVLGRETHLNNVNIAYHCCIAGANFETNIAGLRDFLLSKEGYVKITDTYHTDEYRKGLFMGPFEPKVTESYDGAEFDLVFNCLPQRYLTSGDTAVSIGTSSTTLANPTKQKAKPLIKVTGKDGYVYIGPSSNRYRIKILSTLDLSTYSSIFIDCETMEVYYDGNTSVNLNPYIDARRIVNGSYTIVDDFPVLQAGNNSCYRANVSGTQYGITAAEISPRWWRA